MRCRAVVSGTLVLVFLGVMTGVSSAGVVPLPRHVDPIYFQNGVDLYVLEAPNFHVDYGKFVGQDGGTFVMSIRRLVFEASAPDVSFVLSATPSVDDILILGDDARMHVLTGRHAADAVKQDNVITLTGVGVPTAKSFIYQVGGDTISLLVPQEVRYCGCCSW